MRTKTQKKENLIHNSPVCTGNVILIAPAVSVLFLTLLNKKGGET